MWLWRLAGALGKAWRLHRSHATEEVRGKLAGLLIDVQKLLLPHLGGSDSDKLMEFLFYRKSLVVFLGKLATSYRKLQK